jgi:cell wall-associated NlpC family hydrolase
MRPAQAVVTIAALDLRRRPDHRSELRSQLLLGETVELLQVARSGQWARVCNRGDGYRGWVRTWGLLALTAGEIRAWRSAARWRVAGRVAWVRERRGGGAVVSPLFWNSPVSSPKRRGRFREVVLPDGRRGWLEARTLRSRGRSSNRLRTVVAELLGVPYLWGGRTPLGFDCSGFVQQVMAARGVALPRDAHDQFLACRRVATAKKARRGDLVFFGRARSRLSHVGVVLGRGVYAHARGTVRINSLDPDNALYDNALARMLRSFGRPRAGSTRGSYSC